MRKVLDFLPRIAPLWAAAAGAVLTLLGIWPCIALYEATRTNEAAGFLLFLLFAPIIFFVVLLVLTYPLLRLLERLESDLSRLVACLVPFALFLAMRGVPNLFSLALIGFVAAWAYIYVGRTHADEQDREEFVNEMSREVDVTPGFLGNFPSPLWNKLTLILDRYQTSPAVEGVADGFRFTVLELKHGGWGINNHDDIFVTTFFIVAIPKSKPGRVVTWHPADCEVSVDKAFVYLARPGKRARPGEWQSFVNKTIKVVESLKTREQTAGKVHRPTFRPKGDGVLMSALYAILFLAVTLLAIGFGLATMLGWVDYRTGCLAHSTAAKCLDIKQTYSVIDAILRGGTFVLLGLLPAFGFLDSLRRIRTLRDIQDEVDQTWK